MAQHAAPSVREFLRVLWSDCGTRMSGIFTVPFSICAFLFSGYARAIFIIMAIAAFLLTAYKVWADERLRVLGLEQHLAPLLQIEFDPRNQRFVLPTAAGPTPMLYIRVIARALSPVAQNCRAFLTRISRWDGERYVPVFQEQLPIPWSYEDPRRILPKELNHEIDGLLNVAWLASPNNQGGFPPFGFLNHLSAVPNSLNPVLERHFQHPEENLKLDILLTATGGVGQLVEK